MGVRICLRVVSISGGSTVFRNERVIWIEGAAYSLNYGSKTQLLFIQ